MKRSESPRVERSGWRETYVPDYLVPEPRSSPNRGRKNRRRWCRGREGVEHVLGVRVSKWGELSARRWHTKQSCFRAKWFQHRWICRHEKFCTNCGKIVEYDLSVDCPLFTVEVTRFQRRRES